MSNGGQETVPGAQTPPPAKYPPPPPPPPNGYPPAYPSFGRPAPPFPQNRCRNTIFILANNVREMHRMCNLIQFDPVHHDVILLTNDTIVQRLCGIESPLILTFTCHDLTLHIVEFVSTRHGFIVPVYCTRCALGSTHDPIAPWKTHD